MRVHWARPFQLLVLAAALTASLAAPLWLLTSQSHPSGAASAVAPAPSTTVVHGAAPPRHVAAPGGSVAIASHISVASSPASSPTSAVAKTRAGHRHPRGTTSHAGAGHGTVHPTPAPSRSSTPPTTAAPPPPPAPAVVAPEQQPPTREVLATQQLSTTGSGSQTEHAPPKHRSSRTLRPSLTSAKSGKGAPGKKPLRRGSGSGSRSGGKGGGSAGQASGGGKSTSQDGHGSQSLGDSGKSGSSHTDTSHGGGGKSDGSKSGSDHSSGDNSKDSGKTVKVDVGANVNLDGHDTGHGDSGGGHDSSGHDSSGHDSSGHGDNGGKSRK